MPLWPGRPGRVLRILAGPGLKFFDPRLQFLDVLKEALDQTKQSACPSNFQLFGSDGQDRVSHALNCRLTLNGSQVMFGLPPPWARVPRPQRTGGAPVGTRLRGYD